MDIRARQDCRRSTPLSVLKRTSRCRINSTTPRYCEPLAAFRRDTYGHCLRNLFSIARPMDSTPPITFTWLLRYGCMYICYGCGVCVWVYVCVPVGLRSRQPIQFYVTYHEIFACVVTI